MSDQTTIRAIKTHLRDIVKPTHAVVSLGDNSIRIHSKTHYNDISINGTSVVLRCYSIYHEWQHDITPQQHRRP